MIELCNLYCIKRLSGNYLRLYKGAMHIALTMLEECAPNTPGLNTIKSLLNDISPTLLNKLTGEEDRDGELLKALDGKWIEASSSFFRPKLNRSYKVIGSKEYNFILEESIAIWNGENWICDDFESKNVHYWLFEAMNNHD